MNQKNPDSIQVICCPTFESSNNSKTILMMKRVIIVLAILSAVTGSNAQNVAISTSVSVNSSLHNRLGRYSDREGTSVGGALLGNLIIGVISEGEYWGNIEADETWVIQKTADSQTQVNFGADFAVNLKKTTWLGLSYTNASFNHSKLWSDGRVTQTNEKFSGVMFNIRQSWFRYKWLDLSSGVGFGLAKQDVTGYINETFHPLLGQVTPLRVTASHDNLNVFVAPGLGSTGSQIGLGLTF